MSNKDEEVQEGPKRTVRLDMELDAFLQRQAAQETEGKLSILIRRILRDEMRRVEKKNKVST